MESGLPLMEYPLSIIAVIIIILFLIVLRQSPLHG